MEHVERVAEAVLYEGFLLYPYRRSAMKNQQRWTFGGVYPRAYSESTGQSDPWFMKTECLVAGSENTDLEVRVRFLQVVRRTVDSLDGSTRRPVSELRVDDQVYRPWEEAAERTVDVSGESLGSLLIRPASPASGRRTAIEIPTGAIEEPISDSAGRHVGTVVREWGAIAGDIEVETIQVPVAFEGKRLYKVSIRIANTLSWPQDLPLRRENALPHTMVSTHTIVRVTDGEFISLLEPPDELSNTAKSCENIRTWPVLVGDRGDRHTVLSSPIILYDYPQVSPESHGDFFDATEIDELLALSVLTLTDDEKREMRETDAKAREILDRTESLSPEQLMQLHGAVRGLQSLAREEP
ncbi:MAG TPA: hypothetical protein VF898_14605 [Chloroflexota bacterium]